MPDPPPLLAGLDFGGDSHVEFYRGNQCGQQEDMMHRLGDRATGMHRLHFKPFK